jgi:hypothetical protein
MTGMIQKLLSVRPKFAGKVTIPQRDIATAEDHTRVEDTTGDLVTSQAAVYWIDGSKDSNSLGAGVVQYEDERREAIPCKLGHWELVPG